MTFYHEKQLSRLGVVETGQPVSIQLVNDQGRTNYMDLTLDQYLRIAEILKETNG